MESFLFQFFVFLTASVITVPIANKLGLGSVLGYLMAGIFIGPFGLSLISNVDTVMDFTEFGVVMMLFLVGLELKPSLLWKMRVPILGMGGLQVTLTAIVIGLIASIFLIWQQAIAVGMILALSSTALVVQTLKEKGLMATKTGRSVFSVLLFQDLAVIPMLALLPLLATVNSSETTHTDMVLINIEAYPEYAQLVIILLAVVSVFLIGKYASRPIFRMIAQTRIRELFIAAALAMVVGISLLMTVVGLSPALGTFLAGVALADSEYRHEIESDIEPFKGILLGIFFISIGASFDFTLIGNHLGMIFGISFGLMIIKFLILLGVARIFKMPLAQSSFFAINLAQGGEFAFVLFQFTKLNGVLESSVTETLVSAVAISMFFAPILFKIYEKMSKNRQKDAKESREMDKIDQNGHKVILAGFGRLGTDIGRFLISVGLKPVILDYDSANVEVLRRFGFEVYYGDVTRLDLLESAGASEAEVLIVSTSDLDISRKLIELAKKHYPNLKIVANAMDMDSTYKLMDMHVDQVREETFGTALRMGQDILVLLGMDPYEAYRLMRIFRKHNDEMIAELYEKRQGDLESYISAYQEQMSTLEALMQLDFAMNTQESDKVWTENNPNT